MTLAALSVSGGAVAWAQVATEQLSALTAIMEQVQAFSHRVPAQTRPLLSGGALNGVDALYATVQMPRGTRCWATKAKLALSWARQ